MSGSTNCESSPNTDPNWKSLKFEVHRISFPWNIRKVSCRGGGFERWQSQFGDVNADPQIRDAKDAESARCDFWMNRAEWADGESPQRILDHSRSEGRDARQVSAGSARVARFIQLARGWTCGGAAGSSVCFLFTGVTQILLSPFFYSFGRRAGGESREWFRRRRGNFKGGFVLSLWLSMLLSWGGRL
jgi:hypothetical protein